MGEMRWRGDNRNDPMIEDIVADPEMSAALEGHHSDRIQAAVAEVLQKTDGRKLKGWVAVCMWEDEDGKEDCTVLGDDHSSLLELKAYLHDGVWVAAHSD